MAVYQNEGYPPPQAACTLSQLAFHSSVSLLLSIKAMTSSCVTIDSLSIRLLSPSPASRGVGGGGVGRLGADFTLDQQAHKLGNPPMLCLGALFKLYPGFGVEPDHNSLA